VAFTPDGAWLASGSLDQTVRVWAVASGHVLHTLRRHSDHVVHVAFSPDGVLLASASKDQTVIVWDRVSGQVLHTLRGHTSSVGAVAFSPDGARLASAGWDRAVMVWDMVSGQKLHTLRGHTERVEGVAFSPNGTLLASVSEDGTVKLWDARPLTAELKTELEARWLVESVCAQAQDRVGVLARLRRNKIISEPVRDHALALVPTYWAGRNQAEASRLVGTLYDKPLLREEVTTTIRADHSLAEAVRQRALEQAERLQENPARLNDMSRRVVRQPGQPMEAYRLALRQAETACQLLPYTCACFHTLAKAQFRLGQYEAALNTLARVDELHAKQKREPDPPDLAIQAMAQHQLRQHNQAQATLQRLRESMKHSRPAKDDEAQGFLREAEALIEGRVADPKE
jgi:hypothetical protein